MKITWLGHASFLIVDSKGRRILLDPFDSTVGYKTYKDKADLITISHSHFDHNYIKEIEGDSEVLQKVGFFNLCDIPIKGIPSYHDKVKGAKRGENIIYVLEIDDYSVCHLGDLGHELSKEDLEAIGDVDVLFIPVGGNYTIDSKEASTIAKSINSKIVIPMHYKTPDLSFPLDGVEDFIKAMKNGERVGSNTLEIKGDLQGNNIVKILNYE